MSEYILKYNGKEISTDASMKLRDALEKLGAPKGDLVAARLNGKLFDLSATVREGGDIEPVTTGEKDGLEILRHSAAHLMAQAIMRHYPKARFAIGPTVEDGFYYDIDFGDAPITTEDLPKIEKEMKQIIKQKLKLERREFTREEALAQWEPAGEIYKVEMIKDLPEGTVISTYTQGDFTDMCRGPHVPHTGFLGSVKLMNIAGAYWRGDEKNQMLTRIYGTAWASREELDAYLVRIEEAKKRDHRKLAKQLEMFTIVDTIGKGLPLWLPNGTVIREELEKLAKEKEFLYGYKRVATPHITHQELFVQSGHLPHYKESMFPPLILQEEGEEPEVFYLKPMNCPFHHMIYLSRPRSYKELPLRLTEYGQVYRYEKSGELAGILRVRGMCMNDGHLYCTEDQLKDEFKSVMQLHLDVYKVLGIKNYTMRLSLRDTANTDKSKFINNAEIWARAERVCEEALKEMNMAYTAVTGEAAFYGPKVDVQFRNVLGREETNGTNQVDFFAAERFNLRYVGPDGELHKPVVLHRAPLGTHERFIAFVTEHFAGAFPTWLAPLQVMIIPVASEFADYAQKIREELFLDFVRVEVDDSSDTLNKRIRNAITNWKVPNVLILGDKERSDQSITLRRYGLQRQVTMPLAEFKVWLANEIKTRALPERDEEYKI